SDGRSPHRPHPPGERRTDPRDRRRLPGPPSPSSLPGTGHPSRASPPLSAQVQISTHPLVKKKVTRLRDETTPPKIFRELVAEIATLLLYEATADLPTEPREVTTPLAPFKGARLSEKLGLVPVLRAGVGMVQAALAL